MYLSDDIILHIFLSTFRYWEEEGNLKRLNRHWRRVINNFNLTSTSWIIPENRKRLTILSGKIEVFYQPK